MLIILLVLTAGIGVESLVIWILAESLKKYKSKLRTAEKLVTALNSVYTETQKIREEQNAKMEKLQTVEDCIDYLNGNKLSDDSAKS